MSKSDVENAIKYVNIGKQAPMTYYVNLSTDKDKFKFINRLEKMVRHSLEYKDYINYLKENVELNKCIFFQKVTNFGGKKRKVSIEMHHEPFTLYDIVLVVLNKDIESGKEINDLDIADEVMRLHYEDKVGLVPLSKTAHQIIHNSRKLMIPLTMVYGNYAQFIEEYSDFIPEDMYTKLEKKVSATKNLTEKDFEAITKEFKYLQIEGVDDVEKVPLRRDESDIH